MSHDDSMTLGFVVFWSLFAIYWVPSIVAFSRGHPNRWGVLIVNIVLGWTIVGWVGALLWAIWNKTAASADKTVRETLPEPKVIDGMRSCPFCAEQVRVEAIKCRYCRSDLSAAVGCCVVRRVIALFASRGTSTGNATRRAFLLRAFDHMRPPFYPAAFERQFY